MAANIRQDAIAAKAIEHLNFDASEANTFARELLRVRSGVFEIKFPEMKAMRLMPRNADVNETDEQYTYRVATEYGTTRLGAGYAGGSAPRADVSMVEATPQSIRPITVSYGYDFQEARIAARTGNGLPQRKANAARRAAAQEINRILSFGDSTKYGATLPGLATLSGTDTYSTPNGAGGSPLWANKSPDEILKDMMAMESQVVESTNDVEHPNTLLLPLASFNLVATKRLGDGSDKTILQFFKENAQYIRSVESWYALDAAPNSEWTGKRMMAYDKSPEVLEYLLPIEFEQMAPQMDGFETVTQCHARIGGVVCYRPKAVIYGDGI